MSVVSFLWQRNRSGQQCDERWAIRINPPRTAQNVTQTMANILASSKQSPALFSHGAGYRRAQLITVDSVTIEVYCSKSGEKKKYTALDTVDYDCCNPGCLISLKKATYLQSNVLYRWYQDLLDLRSYVWHSRDINPAQYLESIRVRPNTWGTVAGGYWCHGTL